MVSVARHDIRQPLALRNASIGASYSNMLFCMALTTSELERLAAGFELIDVTDFTEGDLPRQLSRATMRVPQP